MKVGYQSFERVEELKKICNNLNKSNSHLWRNKEPVEFREWLLSFGAESFVFQFAVQKYKD